MTVASLFTNVHDLLDIIIESFSFPCHIHPMCEQDSAPVVFTYLSYRSFLHDFCHYRKAQDARFSFRWFARRAGLAAPGYVQSIITGERNIKQTTVLALARACRLAAEETRYFETLVNFNQARNSRTRSDCYRQLQTFQAYRDFHQLDDAQACYHENWYIPVIYGLAGLPDFRADPGWIAGRLVPKVRPAQAKQALSILKKLELLTERDGRLVQAHSVLSTGPETTSVHMVHYHREMLKRASESIDLIDSRERDISALTLSVGENDLPQLKVQVQRFRKQLLQFAANVPQPKRVVQVNLQLFPVSENLEELNDEKA